MKMSHSIVECLKCDWYAYASTIHAFKAFEKCPQCKKPTKRTYIGNCIAIEEEMPYVVPFSQIRAPNIDVRNKQILEAQAAWQKQEDTEIMNQFFEAVEEQNAGKAIRIEDER